jgi:hypothetical protein
MQMSDMRGRMLGAVLEDRGMIREGNIGELKWVVQGRIKTDSHPKED